MSIFGGGGSAPNPPKPKLIDFGNLQNTATQADITGYNLSDADLASRFPGLVSGRQQQISQAYNQLTGPLDPTVQNSFVNQGLQGSLSAFGGGNPNATVTPGAATGNAVATSIANNVQKKQDYDRSNFENLLASNPQRQFGLTGSDAANVSIANVIARNNYLQAKYGGQVAGSNAQNAAAQQQQAAALAAAVQIATSIIAASDKRIKQDIKTIGKTEDGIPIKTFSYKTDPAKRKHTGFMAQDVEKIKPWAVITDPLSGLKMVNYTQALYPTGGGR